MYVGLSLAKQRVVADSELPISADQKAVLLKAKYDTLSKDKKQLRKAVEKKRRKTVQSDKKLMPAKR